MAAASEIKEKADRLAELARQAARVKAETEQLKAWFERQALEDLKDTKSKTMEYWGSQGARVVVGSADTVKPVSMKMVKELLGDVYPDFVKEETSYKMSEPCKRLLAMMFLGNYTEGTLDKTIRAITGDEKLQRALKKKLKGKYEKDTQTLIQAAGLPPKEASDWAYLTSEIIGWEWMTQILAAGGWQGTPQEAVDLVRAAVIVDEGIKVAVEMEKA